MVLLSVEVLRALAPVIVSALNARHHLAGSATNVADDEGDRAATEIAGESRENR
jgi:hypothetical protein